jgi:hypothetical protein
MMRRLPCGLAGALFGLALLTPASAAPNTADAQKIDACLKAASENDQPGVNCIGIVADPCIAAAKEKNTYWEDSKACAARELAVWNGRLTTALKDSKAGGKDMAATVTAAQAGWSASLTKLCPVFDKLDPGAVLGGANYCRLQQTAMQVLVLERLANAVNPH